MSTSPSYFCCCEPEFNHALLLIECRHDALSGLAEHALHPGAVAAGLGSKQRPRAARAEAARVARWWPWLPWLDSNGVTLFVHQYDRGTCCELLLAVNTWYRYLIRGMSGRRIIRKKWNACFYIEPRYIEPRIRLYTRTSKFKNEEKNRRGKKGQFLNLKKSCIINGPTFEIRQIARQADHSSRITRAERTDVLTVFFGHSKIKKVPDYQGHNHSQISYC